MRRFKVVDANKHVMNDCADERLSPSVGFQLHGGSRSWLLGHWGSGIWHLNLLSAEKSRPCLWSALLSPPVLLLISPQCAVRECNRSKHASGCLAGPPTGMEASHVKFKSGFKEKASKQGPAGIGGRWSV